ncbi:MAG: NAD(P)/FAD-dependent oxidoreductase [Solirubrobacterales bacterium]|nr:NAD(P)/FAD-dependent oxidoreductase [Solirubrobacterales bacterium]MBV9807699.1 NAD(P)/FAD-dependent oxidoreductase [Solirubrobacterales bacterium]
MKKHVVIVGAGFAGLELAARLSESLADAVHVTLIDRNDTFYFGFSKLDVLLGRRAPQDVLLRYGEIAKPGVEFRQETVAAIDPRRRRVITDQGAYQADFLAVALGAEYDLAATPGFQQGGFEFYSLAGAERLRDALADFAGGTILISVLGHPFKCPPAPFEGAFLLHDLLLNRGVRDATEIRMTFPMAAPVPVTQQVSQVFRTALEERGIQYAPKQLVVGLDPRARSARLASGASLPYDMFIGIPVHRAPEVVNHSGLAVEGWVPVEQTNLATRFPGVYALGDIATGARTVAKAGIFAEAAARVVAADIAARIEHTQPPAPYQGDGPCYIEFGGGLVGKVEVNFLGGPTPTGRILPPTQELAAEKKTFAATRRQRWFGHHTHTEPVTTTGHSQ